MEYHKLSEADKKNILISEYEKNNLSFREIANKYNTYANKIRRDAIKFKINIKDKSVAQQNALKLGKTKHPTKGKNRSDETKDKIGNGVMKAWEDLDNKTKKQRRDKARENWEKLSDDTKSNILKQANDAVRVASKNGSKLEIFLLEKLLEDGHRVDFHKEQTLSNTKLQIDLFLPQSNIAIEVDGPSHFAPVWGEEALKRNKTYDNKKSGLIIGKGLVLIRIKQTKDFSKARASKIYSMLKEQIEHILKHFPDSDHRNIEIGD